MSGRTIVVTGSASGIGAAVRALLESEGAAVVGLDVHDAEVVADLSDAGGRAAAVSSLVGATGHGLDALVVCAGLGPHVRPAGHIVAVNYFGAVGVLDGLLEALAAGSNPAAVAISSNSAGITPVHQELLSAMESDDEARARGMADDLDGATVYGTSKLALARGVRRRVASWGAAGVRLNAVAPGPIDTPLLAASRADPTLGPLVDALPIPLSRHGTTHEIASVVSFLLGPSASYIHGSVLFADGGTDALLRPDAV